MCDTVCSPVKINRVCGGMMMMLEEWSYGSDVLEETNGYGRFLQRQTQKKRKRMRKQQREFMRILFHKVYLNFQACSTR